MPGAVPVWLTSAQPGSATGGCGSTGCPLPPSPGAGAPLAPRVRAALLPTWQNTRHLLPQRDPAARGSAQEASRDSELGKWQQQGTEERQGGAR